MASKIRIIGTAGREEVCRDFNITEKNPATCGDYISLMWYKDKIGRTFSVEKNLGWVYVVSGAPDYSVGTVDSKDAEAIE